MYELNEFELASVVGGGGSEQENNLTSLVGQEAEASAEEGSVAVALNLATVTQNANNVSVFH